MHILELKNIYYKVGKFSLKDINIYVDKAEKVGIYAKPGQGKTSIIEIISQVVEAKYGKIFFEDEEICDNQLEIKRKVSVVYEQPNFNLNLKLASLAEMIKSFEPDFKIEEFYGYAEKYNLNFKARLKEYSKVDLKKLTVFIAFCRKPKLILIDDISVGLDSNGQKDIFEFINKEAARDNVAILFTSSDKELLEKYSDRYYKI
ncbi:ABC-type multidrug transport system, ATPase component [Lachnospiraceae bacterium C7]|nr:ABC-type multidrug transport system, ATPase component [Lachnospiraceae bacterium C7]